jgi:hypothetical protein
MVRLARVEAGDVVLDPMCGGGSIPLEGCQIHSNAFFLGTTTTITFFTYRLSTGTYRSRQCSGSVTFRYGSGICGSVPPTNLAQDPALFVSDLQDGNKKNYFCLLFLLINIGTRYFLKVLYIYIILQG